MMDHWRSNNFLQRHCKAALVLGPKYHLHSHLFPFPPTLSPSTPSTSTYLESLAATAYGHRAPLSTTLCVGPLLVLFYFIIIALPSSILATPVYNPHKDPPQSLIGTSQTFSPLSLLVITEATGVVILSEGLPKFDCSPTHHNPSIQCPSRTIEKQ
ncbi:hypothetical protein BGW80DRAFT_181796 [Lactifluus volemus]|nr:hypothetical protein BGW80DRAFT_181796 [Lactifluus volemus]